jgi:hypothetical protein
MNLKCFFCGLIVAFDVMSPKVFQDVIAYYEAAALKLNISEDETQRGDFT